MQQLRKTVIGSFARIDEQLDRSIEKAIDVQLKHGLDIVSDGEQRTDMICYFEQIPGLSRLGKKVAIAGRIRKPHDVEDLYKIRDFVSAKKYLERKRKEGIGLKVGVTGPITLGFTCASSGLKEYRNIADLALYRDLAYALSPLIDELLRLGGYVQIDEPGLSAGFLNPTSATTVINEMVSDLRNVSKDSDMLSLHACGDLTKTPGLFKQLMSVQVSVVSLALAGRTESRNLQLLSDQVFVSSRKRLGLGCVDVTPLTSDSVSSVQEIVKLLNGVIQQVGPERISYIHPNCGLKDTPLEVAEEILKRMRLSAEQIASVRHHTKTSLRT